MQCATQRKAGLAQTLITKSNRHKSNLRGIEDAFGRVVFLTAKDAKKRKDGLCLGVFAFSRFCV